MNAERYSPTPSRMVKVRAIKRAHAGSTSSEPQFEERVKPETRHRKIRIPKQTAATLRALRAAYNDTRKIPQLVNACLKQTRDVKCALHQHTTRNESEVIDIWLSDEFRDLEHSEIVARVGHALIGVQAKLDHYQLSMQQ